MQPVGVAPETVRIAMLSCVSTDLLRPGLGDHG